MLFIKNAKIAQTLINSTNEIHPQASTLPTTNTAAGISTNQ